MAEEITLSKRSTSKKRGAYSNSEDQALWTGSDIEGSVLKKSRECWRKCIEYIIASEAPPQTYEPFGLEAHDRLVV
ncbi:hypothetical protein N9174_01740 [bacterium]|nr:hypothetical protein [bacterium]